MNELLTSQGMVSINVTEKNVYNKQFLIATCNNNLVDMKHYVSLGADPQCCDNYAVVFASSYGHLDTLKFLVSQGANINARYYSSFFEGIKGNHVELVKYLIQVGAIVDSYHLDLAIRYKRPDILSLIMMFTALLPSIDHLVTAIENNDRASVMIMIQYIDEVPEIVLRYVIANNDYEMMKYIVAKKINVNTHSAHLAYYKYTEMNNLQMIQLLLMAGYRPTTAFSLLRCVELGSIDMVMLLLPHHTSEQLDEADLILSAIMDGHFDIVSLLIGKGFKVFEHHIQAAIDGGEFNFVKKYFEVINKNVLF